MFYSINEVNSEFFKLFSNVSIVDKKSGTPKVVLARYFKKSSGDYTEEQKQQVYPCIVIADYTPTIDDVASTFHNTYTGGTSEDGKTGFVFTRPYKFQFRYDVAIATKSYFDWVALKDYFFKYFIGETQILMKAQLTGENRVGDVVQVKEIRPTDINRTDGVFETNFEFTLGVWMCPKEPKEETIVQEIILTAEEINITATEVSDLE